MSPLPVTIPQADMDAFTAFVLRITYSPNPNRRLDNVLTPDQDAGRRLFDRVNCGIPSAPARSYRSGRSGQPASPVGAPGRSRLRPGNGAAQ